ncbi:MAG: hypothetical protein V4496_05015 [Pseudomonadota bacterium]
MNANKLAIPASQPLKEKLPLLLNNLYLLAQLENELEEKLNLYQFVASCFNNNHSNTYAHKQFEQDLTTISCELINNALPEYKDNNHVLHVLTEVYHTGGHTRVVDNWIKTMSNQQHSIIINHSAGEIPAFLKNAVHNSQGDIIINNETSLIDKAKFLAKIACQFHHVVLHIFPHDILPLLAFGTPYYTRPTFFYNHGDHLWGCGYSVCDAILEICMHGKNHSNLYRGIPKERTKFVGIPVEININIADNNKEKEQQDSKIIVSMATYYKFEPLKELSFQDFIDRILTHNNQIIFCIIGVENHQESWQWLLKKHPKKVNLLGTLAKHEAHQIIKRADLYLDSFPMGSATSMIEAISLGVPALSYKSIINNLDSFKDFYFSTLDELMHKIFEVLNYTEAEREKFLTHILSSVRYWHDLNNFKDRVEKNTESYVKHDPLTLADNIISDNYIEQYSDFMYQLLQGDAFRFDYALFTKLNYKNHNKICRLLEKYGLLYTTKQAWGDTTIFEAMDGIKYFRRLFISSTSKPTFNENQSKAQHSTCDDHITFDLSEYQNIQSLRFDPINYPAKIKIISSEIELANGDTHSLKLKWHNGAALSDVIDFPHAHPQITFDIPSELSDFILRVKFHANIQPYNRADILSLQHSIYKNSLNYKLVRLRQKTIKLFRFIWKHFK